MAQANDIQRTSNAQSGQQVQNAQHIKSTSKAQTSSTFQQLLQRKLCHVSFRFSLIFAYMYKQFMWTLSKLSVICNVDYRQINNMENEETPGFDSQMLTSPFAVF